MFYQFFESQTDDFFKIEEGENLNFPQHLHMCYELVILLDGELTINIGDTPYVLKKNNALLIFPNQLHSFKSENSHHILFLFSPKYIQSYAKEVQGFIPENNLISISQNMIDDFLSLNENSTKFEIKGCLYKMCGYFHRTATYKASYNDENNLLTSIFSFVEKNFNKDCSLSELSKATGREYTYLSRIFKQFTGISYVQYVNMMRLNYAGYLLHNTDLSILECSIECGYNSLRSFNRNFKSYHGVTPKDYRLDLSLSHHQA